MCRTDEQTNDPKVRMKLGRNPVSLSASDSPGRSAAADDEVARAARSVAGAGFDAPADSEDFPTFEGLVLMIVPAPASKECA